MSFKYRNSILTVAVLTASGCGGQRPAAVVPRDPIGSVGVSPLPVGSLAGSNALLLTIGGLVVGDSVAALEARHTELLDAANAALDTALRRDAREVTWQGLPEQRRAMRRSPTLNVDPDRLPTEYLIGTRVETVPDPLWSEVRTLSAMMGARYAIVPAAVRIAGAAGAYRASYVLVAVDARTGQVVWRGRTDGAAAASPEAALARAAGAVVLSPLR